MEGKERTTSSKVDGLDYSGDKNTIGRPKGPSWGKYEKKNYQYGHQKSILT